MFEFTVTVGHQKFPTWHTLWAQINRRVTRLEGIYAGTRTIENTGDLEDEVDALLLCIANLADWMIADPDVGGAHKGEILEMTLRRDPLTLCRDYANTFKHHTYWPAKSAERYARLHETTSDPNGVSASLHYWKEDGHGAEKSVDGLVFSQNCIAEWRTFLADHGIEDPQPK